jgi:hypothetical protein
MGEGDGVAAPADDILEMGRGPWPLSWLSSELVACRLFERDGRTELRVGRMAIVYDGNDETRTFVDAVWKEFRRLCANRLIAHDFSNAPNGTPVHDVWLGADARRWHERGGRLASNSADLHYSVQ